MAKPQQKFSREVIAAFRRARDARGDDYNDACLALEIALKRLPWQEDLMDCDTDEPPGYIAARGEADAQNARTWSQARKLRLALEEAAGNPKA